MKILITGATGFVAGHLVRELEKAHHELILTCMGDPKSNGHESFAMDITDEAAVFARVKATKPDAIVHLAGMSHVAEAAAHRELLARVNIVGTHHLCAAASRLSHGVKFLFASSSQVYGQPESGDSVFSEHSPVKPINAYGHSKLAAEGVIQVYQAQQFKVSIVRPFNHIGPGQHINFVCPSLAKRILEAQAGGTIQVGDLNVYRDFTDVRDVVNAYRLILEKDLQHQTFVVGSGTAVKISEVLDKLVKISGKRVTTQVEPSLLRENDPQKMIADPSLLERTLGWQRSYSLERTLTDIYESLAG